MTSATDNVGEAELRTTLTDVFRETEEIMMTIAEKWRLEGEEIGIKKGEEIGIKRGEEIGKQKTLVQILESRFDTVSEEIQTQIEQCNLEQLDELVDLALEAKTIDELVGRLHKWHEVETNNAVNNASDAEEQSDSEI